jgi:predicted HTH domain antitoxin
MTRARKSIVKHSPKTAKQLDAEEPEETDVNRGNEQHDEYDIVEEVLSLSEVSAKVKMFKQRLMRRGIKIRYSKEEAQKDLVKKYGGRGHVAAKKFGLRKAYYAVPSVGSNKPSEKPKLVINKPEMEKLHRDKEIDKGNLKVVYKEQKELLLMGGAYGHMAHPFDDKDLTFKDLKNIITMGLGGTLSREDNVTEKTDGQNLMISWKDGKLIAARNKGHIKNKGKTALDIKGVESKFKGRGDIRNAFVYAVRDLSKAIGALSDKQQNKVFGEGSKWMSLEVMWPASENVVNYDITELMFHGTLEYDDSARVIGQAKDSARILAGMIKQVNQNIQKHYKIKKPHFMTVPKHQDFGKLKGKFLGKLKKLQSQYALKDNDTLSLYHQMYWQEWIFNGAKQTDYPKITNEILVKLTKRWAFFDKSYKISQIKKDLKEYPKFLEWVLSTDKNDHAKMVKGNMKPFEELFFEVGATVLKNMDGWMAVNPAKSVQNMRKKLQSAIKDIRSGGDLKKLNKLKQQLDKLNAIGGLDAVVPTEGIVFKYNGNVYKFTGAFAPINQITGMMTF